MQNAASFAWFRHLFIIVSNCNGTLEGEPNTAIASLAFGIISLVNAIVVQDGEMTATFLGLVGLYLGYKAMRNGETETVPGLSKAGLICSGFGQFTAR